MNASQRKSFLESLSTQNYEVFFSSLEKYKIKQDYDFKELFESISQQDSSQLFSDLNDIFQTLFQEDGKLIQEKKSETIKFIQAATNLATSFISDKKRRAPDSLFAVTQILHGLIFLLVNELEQSKLANEISLLCETWWANDLAGKEELVVLTISYLVSQCLAEGKVGDILRLYNIRAALLLIDFQDEGSVSLKRMLLRSLIHPVFLRNKKGKLFLTYLFGLLPSFIEELNATIKSQLANCKPSMIEAYGEIYFKAWKAASGPYLVKIEYACVQDLMNCGIHVENSKVTSAIRKILSAFHSQKKTKGVDEMLLRLYEPILWRSLKVANPIVRKNAVGLFFEAFPLQDTDGPQRNVDENLQKQFDLIETVLYDPNPDVRVVAVTGVARILSLFWELIPKKTIQVLVCHLINHLAFDVSSSNVRIAVLDGLRVILDNHLSQSLLNALLPTLQPLIHDTTERVRAAMVKLLDFVKHIRSIHFYDIVSVEDLLTRLSIESETVAKLIVTLLLNSYFPYQKNSQVQVKRVLVLLKTNKIAGKKFFQNVKSLVPVPACAKLIGHLYQMLRKCISEEDSVGSFDIEIIEGIFEIMNILWEDISPHLSQKENLHAAKFLSETFSDNCLLQLILPFESRTVRELAFRLASHLNAKTVPEMVSMCLSQLQNLTDESNFGTIIECLFAWNCSEQVLGLVKQLIHAPFSTTSSTSNSRKKPKTSKKKDNNNEATIESNLPPFSQALLGMKLINYIMARESLRTPALACGDLITQILEHLLQYFTLLQQEFEENKSQSPTELIITAVLTHSKLYIHASASFEEVEQDCLGITELVSWIQTVFLPILPSKPSISSSLEQNKKRNSETLNDVNPTDLVSSFCQCVMIIFSEYVTLGLCSQSLIQTMFPLIKSIVSHNQKNGSCLSSLLPLVFKFIFQVYKLGEEDEAFSMLQEILKLIPKEIFQSSINFKIIKLGEIASLQAQKKTLCSFTNQLVSTLVIEQLNDDEEPSTYTLPNKFEHLEPIAGFILQAISKSSPWINALAKYLTFLPNNIELDSAASIYKSLQIISIMTESGGSKGDLSPLQNCLMSFLSKLPDNEMNDKNESLRIIANTLLKKSMK